MKKSLYHIEQQYLDIAEQLSYGETSPELEEALAITSEELQTKAINYGFVIKDSEANIEAIDNEINRLKALKESEEKKRDRLIDAIKNAMILFGVEKVDSPILKLFFRRSPAIEIVNESQLDRSFMVKKVTYSPDKKKIKEAIERGEDVQGAILKTNQNLQIK